MNSTIPKTGETRRLLPVACCIITYQPEKPIPDIVQNFLDIVERVYIIDNTPSEKLTIWQTTGKFQRKQNGKNTGIAAALNQALHRASQEGFRWLLTMDQDSEVDSVDLHRFLDAGISFMKSTPSSALVSVSHEETRNRINGITEKPFVMTSGNLVRVSHAIEAGGWKKRLFVDHVDHEFCLRLRNHGYSIWEAGDFSMKHNPGVRKRGETSPRLHRARRFYYMNRNLLWLQSVYGRDYVFELRQLRTQHRRHIRTNLIHNPERVAVLFYTISGLVIGLVWMLFPGRNASRRPSAPVSE